jgi:CreA protein
VDNERTGHERRSFRAAGRQPRPGGAILTLGVNDIEKARAWLESKGVKFDGATREVPDMVKLATFFDPDGNTFMLAQGLQR